MSTVTNHQIYELALEVQRAVEQLSESVDDVLDLMKTVRKELSEGVLRQVESPSIHGPA